MTRPLAALPAAFTGVAITVPLLAGCGGGGGSAAASTMPPPVVISGAITFDRVPVSGSALDYTGIEAAPARGVTVQALADGQVIASASTDETGRYTLTVPADTSAVTVRALAEMRREGTPGWSYRVVDNTADNALFVLEGPALTLGRTDQTLNLHAPSGWDDAASAYTAPRSAAPFAILDVIRDVTDFVLASVPDTVFPPLVVHWSPNNVPSRGADGQPDLTTGEIGSSLYRHGLGIYLLGAADSDTDEYDRHVIAHEWAHYLEQAFGRSDSIGGPHTRGDQLDPRTAFSEGFANAFAAMALGDTRYVDVLGPAQAGGFAFDVEGPYAPFPLHPNPFPGWFSEESIQEVVYDLFDAEQDRVEDTLALGFAPLLAVFAEDFTNNTPYERPLTSIFAFADALRRRLPEHRAEIDALLAANAIGPFADAYGTGEANAGWPLDPASVEAGDILPLYKQVDLGGRVNVCSTDAYTYPGATGFYNKLGSRAFVRFDAPAAGVYVITATTTELPAGKTADPDLALHGQGLLHRAEGAPDPAACTAQTPSGCVESFERFLGPGTYVLEVYEWTNTQPADPESEFPPIGRTCFDVTVTPQ
ncbi:MAG TPA: carboxypeptidase-like regulatory domain-containing protein [Gammaproteobacteria bacterium]